MIYTHGKTCLDRKNLNLIPIPDRGDTVSDIWQGLNHGKLATAVVNGIKSHGLEIRQETWYVNPSRTDLFGAVDIEPNASVGATLDIGQEALFSLGVRHSNVGKYAVSFCVGARIVVCSNGLFTGDFTLKRRHTTKLDLAPMIDAGIVRYLQEAEHLETFINGMRAVDINDRDAAHAILQSHEDKLINFRYLEGVDKLWRNPPHAEFEPRTAWSLYNAFTETAKEISPPRQLRLLSGLRPLFEREFQLAPSMEPVLS